MERREITASERGGATRKDRFLGCLLGLAVGDALGMPVEGLTQDEIVARHGWLEDYQPRLGPDGEIDVPAGEFTGDTETALCLLESLVSSNGYLDLELAGARLLRLYHDDARRFLGRTTLAALAHAEETGEFQRGASGDWPPGVGAASRIAPVALMQALGHFNPEVFTREVLRAGLITHSAPEALNGALAVAYGIRLLVNGEIPPELLLEEVAAFIDEDEVARALRRAARLARDGGERARDLANLREIGGGPHVAEAVAAAFYAFRAHPEDFRAAVLTALNGGGDADSIAAITGALAGAHLGATAIPAELVDGLEGRMYLLMAAPGLYRAAQRRAGLFLKLIERE
ncbi:MAG TPA: ADP-ribosylglycohydrolase family protein [Thermomicrobiaceae bacterium]|nr:ADP-ribosylglycohydrolase family protein [Thermomicrobiaceae bacterium]